MRNFSQRAFSVLGLLLLGGCNPKVECDSPETRSAVLTTISDDHRNALATFAARNSNVPKEELDSKLSPTSEGAKPFYRLSEKMVTVSMSKDKRTLKCSGGISVVVGNAKASKEVNYTVQRSTDGKISVSVDPFQFEATR